MFVSRFSALSLAGFALLASACTDDMQIQRPMHVDAIDQTGGELGDDKELDDVDAGAEPQADAGSQVEADAGSRVEADAGSAETDAAPQADAGQDAAQAAAEGLPCEIEKLLKMRCQGCHSAQAKNGTALMTFENLMAAAKVDPNATVYERVLARITSSERPMPPMGKGTPVSAEEIAQFQAWIDDGTPGDACKQ